MRYLIVAFTAIVALGSCSKDDSTTTEPLGNVAVSFFNAQIATRTVGDEWEDNDEVGVYMSGANNSSEDRANVRYTTTANGVFSIYSEVGETPMPILYPQSTTDLVDFNAYYPYSSSLSGELITINVKEQNSTGKNQGDVDFMVADKLENRAKTTEVEKFIFKHKLSMLVLELTLNSEISSFDNMVTTIENVSRQAQFNVLTGAIEDDTAEDAGSITFVMETIDGTMTASAILLPGDIASGTKINFKQGTNTYPLTLKSSLKMQSGTKHIFSVVVGQDTVLFTGESEIEDWNEVEPDRLYSNE